MHRYASVTRFVIYKMQRPKSAMGNKMGRPAPKRKAIQTMTRICAY